MTFESDAAELHEVLASASGHAQPAGALAPGFSLSTEGQAMQLPDANARRGERESNRAVLAQVLYSALRNGASASEVRESFREALFDAVRRIRNEDGLTVNQAARDYGVRRNDLASKDVDDQLDVAILRVAMKVVTIVQRHGVKTQNGWEMTHEQIHAELDAGGGGLWATLIRTYPRDAFRYVMERVLKSNGVSEPETGRVAVPEKSFFPAVKLSEAIPYAHFSVGEYVDVVNDVVSEMKSVAYRAGLRLRQSPRTRDAAYASLQIKWNGDACSLVDALRAVAQGACNEGESLTLVVGARKARKDV
jgi:hypothetical protein